VPSRVLVTIYPSTWCNNPDALNFQQHGCENLKTRAVPVLGRYLMITVSLTSQETVYNVLTVTNGDNI